MRYRFGVVVLAFSCVGRDVDPGSFDVVAVLDVGLNPHQIAFSHDGNTAWIAAAGSDRLTVVDVESLTSTSSIPVADAPLGVAVLPNGDLAATRFAADEIVRLAPGGGAPLARVRSGGAPSLLVGPLPSGHLLVSVEQSDLIWFLDGGDFTLVRTYEVGDRPFPPAATTDGRFVFVPNYNDGTVTVIDVENERVAATTPVGARPSGGAVLPGDSVYAVAVRGDNKIVLVSTMSYDVVDSLLTGIGEEPFSVVVAPNGRLAFVNNTASHDVSVIDVARLTVLARIAVGEQPIVMAVHPSGETLWVSSEGSDELAVIAIPQIWREAPARLEH